jgi:hypothetical protein
MIDFSGNDHKVALSFGGLLGYPPWIIWVEEKSPIHPSEANPDEVHTETKL